MDVHPWTKYEIARLGHEERLLRARVAMQALEARRCEAQTSSSQRTTSWLDRIRRRGSVTKRAPAGAG
jgi:hypothetical protein